MDNFLSQYDRLHQQLPPSKEIIDLSNADASAHRIDTVVCPQVMRASRYSRALGTPAGIAHLHEWAGRFEESVEVFLLWHKRFPRRWQDLQLRELLVKLLEAAPTVQALIKVLTAPMIEVCGERLSMMDVIADAEPHPCDALGHHDFWSKKGQGKLSESRKKLGDTIASEMKRVLDGCSTRRLLDEFLEARRQDKSLAARLGVEFRAVFASDAGDWDIPPEQLLDAVEKLEFEDDREGSETLIRAFVNFARDDYLPLYPRLLARLPRLKLKEMHDEVKEVNITARWVVRTIDECKDGQWATQLGRLYTRVNSEWGAWNAKSVRAAMAVLQKETTERQEQRGGDLPSVVRKLGGLKLEQALFDEWLLPSVHRDLAERSEDVTGGGKRCHAAFLELTSVVEDESAPKGQAATRKRGKQQAELEAETEAQLRELPHALSEQVLIRMLKEVRKSKSWPSKKHAQYDLEVAEHLLHVDRQRLWLDLLELCNRGKSSKQGGKFGKELAKELSPIVEILKNLGAEIKARSITIERALSVLKIDEAQETRSGGGAVNFFAGAHTMRSRLDDLLGFFQCVGVKIESADMLKCKEHAAKVLATFDALLYTIDQLCDDAADIEPFKAEVQRVSSPKGRGTELRATEAQDHFWGGRLSSKVREVTQYAHRLKNSKLFKNSWEKHKDAAREEDPQGTSMDKLLGPIFDSVRKVFEARSKEVRADYSCTLTPVPALHVFISVPSWCRAM